MMSALSVWLLSGCATKVDPLCAVVRPIYFGSQNTVDWLFTNDKLFLRDVVAQSEVIQSTCH